MKQTAKRILAFVSVVCIAFIGVFTMPFVSVNAAAGEWTLVTDASTLAVGDKVIIAAKDSNYALSTTQNSNNRGQASITKSGDTATFGDDVQVLTLAAGNTAGAFAFNTGSGYLYCASTSSKNYLRTQANIDAKASWTISTTSAGVATIKSKVSGIARNMLSYNQQSTCFACYSAVQKNICLYEYIESGATEEPEVPVEPEEKPSITLSGDDYTQVGDTLTITPTAENLTEAINWTSSNTDVATVAGGVVTGKAMGKATIKATANGVEATKEIKVYPVAGEDGTISIATAIEVCKLTGATNPYTYSTTGTIASIDTPYDSKYGNITVTITDGTNSIEAFRMAGGEELSVGAKIKVTGALVNYNGKTPEFNSGCTYELLESDVDVEGITSALNAVDAYMSLGYKYTQTTDNVAVSAEVTDTLVVANTGKTSDKYSDWTYTAPSGVAYAGNSSKKNDADAIQLRSNNSNSGIVTTTSGGKAKKVTLVWNSGTASERKVDVYGSNTAFTSATQLYNIGSGIEKLGSIKYGTSTELEITDEYEYIGIRSNSGALYLDSVSITWVNEGAGSGETVEKVTFSEVDFRIKCGVNASVADIADVDSYGIRVSAGGKTVEYTSDANSWATDDEGVSYVLLTLGDIINDVTKLTTEFTVEAYVVVDGVKFISEKAKTYSVASLVETYYKNGYDVTHLYNHLVEIGAIKA